MVFVPPGPRLRINRYGIAEFDSSQRAAPWSMQYVFLPLVGFDARGNRLGMGAGFYDRALAFRRQRRHWRGPRLIGIAHSCQEAPSIEPLATDIPLDAVVTERGIRVFRGDFA
jgi:5-formyltetrahydrofolate cyclo-ligase